jgi:predicted TIM-barrel fold metal-dependent hydrolase
VSTAALPIIDVDTHLSEPPDLWTSRMPAKWGDRIPRLELDERRGEERWVVAGHRLTGVANWAFAGWHDYPPSHPLRIEDADPAAFEAAARITRMDSEGIVAEVPYPNLLGFSAHAFLDLGDPALMLDCIRAYNDFLVEWASPDPSRFVLLTSLPFWDVEASVAEIERCYEMGHRGILFATKPYKVGMPRISDEHWDPVFRACEERGLSVNFHVGFQDMNADDMRNMIGQRAARSEYALRSSLVIVGLSEGLGEIILGGVCHRFPNLKFVSVESGFGWVPYFIELLDWQWVNSGAAKAYPERELPSTYFRKQVYTTFWFEQETVRRMLDLYPDNVMFESDFPHATSLSPGPASSAKRPRDTAVEALAGMPDDLCRKVLYENAANLYGIDVPA